MTTRNPNSFKSSILFFFAFAKNLSSNSLKFRLIWKEGHLAKKNRGGARLSVYICLVLGIIYYIWTDLSLPRRRRLGKLIQLYENYRIIKNLWKYMMGIKQRKYVVFIIVVLFITLFYITCRKHIRDHN